MEYRNLAQGGLAMLFGVAPTALHLGAERESLVVKGRAATESYSVHAGENFFAAKGIGHGVSLEDK
jgi:hypothetical protein